MNQKAFKSSRVSPVQMARGTSEIKKMSRHSPPGIVLGIADPTLRQQIAARLGDLGCDIEAVGDGLGVIERLAEALERDEGPRPSLLVLDALLPGITGLSVLTSLRELDWQVPIVILAAPGDESAIGRARNAGASCVFTTPFAMEELHHAVEEELSLHIDRAGMPLLPIGRRRTRGQTSMRPHRKAGYKSARLAAAREANSNA
jgi:DNA-binding response OmpR family regulator